MQVWLGMTQVITSQQGNYQNVKYMHKCSERLAFKQFLMPVIRNIKVETHLALVGHRNSLWNTRKQLKYMELLNNDTQNANTVPVYAVEAT